MGVQIRPAAPLSHRVRPAKKATHSSLRVVNALAERRRGGDLSALPPRKPPASHPENKGWEYQHLQDGDNTDA